MTPFFDLNIYIKNTQPIGENPVIYTEDELFNVCYYKYSDTITIPTNSTIGSKSIILTRFALRYSSAGLKGQKFNNSNINITPKFEYIKPSQKNTILYSTNLNAILLNKSK